MKRFSFVLAVILLVVLTACSPGYDRLAESPHEDPAQAPEFLDPLSLLRFYGSALDLAAAGKYQNAQDLLAELEQANIPDELSYIIDRYNELCRQLFSTLDGLEPLLEEASALLDENRIDDAEQKLELAAALGDEAGLLVAEMTTVTADLGDSLGAIAELVSGELGLAHERLVDILGRLSQLLERLKQLRQGLIQAVAQARTVLIATELSLSITPASLFVGDSTTFYGRLTAASSGLGGRELTLLLDDRQQTVTTGPDGSYRATVAVPYNYVAGYDGAGAVYPHRK